MAINPEDPVVYENDDDGQQLHIATHKGFLMLNIVGDGGDYILETCHQLSADDTRDLFEALKKLLESGWQ